MAVAKVILVTLVLTLLTLGTVDAYRTSPNAHEANVLLERRGVVDNLVNDVAELLERVPKEELDDLMKDVEAIEKHVPKEVLDDLVKKVEELQKQF